MLKRTFLGLALVALLGAGYALAAGLTVSLTGNGPVPTLATVEWGDTVTFQNDDNKAHQVTIPRTGLQSPVIEPGGTFTQVFDGRRGNYGYRQTGGGGPNRLGTIVVNLTGTVTLTATPTIVPFGKTLRLSGKSSFPGTPVNVEERVPGGGGDWVRVARVEATGADGSFSIELKPTRGARYRAQVAADQILSQPVMVALQPVMAVRALAIRAKTGKLVTFVGRISPAKAAKSLDLERYDTRRKRWLTQIRKTVPGSGVVTFKWPVRKGASRLRVTVRPLTLTVGWSVATSPAVTVTGI